MKLKKFQAVQMLEFAGIAALAAPLYLLPRAIAFRAGEWLGDAAYHLLKSRREIGRKNLIIAFGDEFSAEQRETIIRTTFRNFGKSLVETLHFPKLSKQYLSEKVTFTGYEHYFSIRQQERGLLFLTGHLGNWEMIPHSQSARGYPSIIVARALDNRFLDKVVTQRRTMFGNRVISRRNGLKQIIAALQKKEDVGILMDQNTSRSKGIFVDFFGKPACTTPVIALLALRYRIPVLPGFTFRTGVDTHTLQLYPEVEIERTGDFQRDLTTNTARFNAIIEQVIREHPDQWFWIHNRWKTQPL